MPTTKEAKLQAEDNDDYDNNENGSGNEKNTNSNKESIAMWGIHYYSRYVRKIVPVLN
jgi:hypothetical protein